MDSQTSPQDSLLDQIPPEVLLFLDNLLKDAGITPIDELMREQLIAQLYSKLDNFVAATILEKMPPQNLEEFTKLNEDGKPREEIEQFIKDKMPNSEQVFAKAFIDFRDLYLGNTGVSANQPPAPPTN